jgi:hypothetical protein
MMSNRHILAAIAVLFAMMLPAYGEAGRNGGRGGGPGGGMPRMAAPMAAPRMAPMAAPRMAAPMMAPHYAAPRMAPMAVPHFAAAPHYAAPRMAAPRFVAPHYAAVPHFVAPPHVVAPRRVFVARPPVTHFAAPHVVVHHAAARAVPRAAIHRAAVGAAAGAIAAGAAAHHAATAPHLHAATTPHISTPPKATAHVPSALAPHVGAETKQHTHAQVVPHAGPAHALPGLAPLAPLVAPHHAQGPAGREHAAAGPKSRIPALPAHANPRRVGQISAGMKPHVVAHHAQPLRWSSRAEIPRAGKVHQGRPGIMDPGGYVRTLRHGTPTLSRGDISNRLNAMPNAEALRRHNDAFRNTQIGTWPNSWYPVPGWQTTGGWWNTSGLGYYDNYWWNDQFFPFNYYALAGYCPTPYIFDVNSGLFLSPGLGYLDFLPLGYEQPITVAITEVVPEYDFWGNIVGYRQELFYYNAVWDPAAQAYGYYDYRGQFHYVTFPWLNSWMGEYMP